MTPEQPGQVRNRRPRILFVALGLVLLLGLGLLGATWGGRRTLGERILHRQLRSLRAEGLVFQLTELGPGQTRLTDARIGEALRIADLEARYSLSGLARLRLKRLTVQGIELPIRREAEGWRVPLVEWINQLQLPAATDQAPSFAVTLPEARADASVRLIHHRLGEWNLPLHITAAVLPQQLEIAGQLDLLGNPQTFAASLDPELSGTVRLTGHLADLSALHTLCRYLDLPLPLALLPGESPTELVLVLELAKGQPRQTRVELGMASARILLEGNEIGIAKLRVLARSSSPDLANWEIEATATGLGGFGASIPELRLAATGGTGGGEATLSIPRLAVGPFGLDEIQIAVNGSGETLAWTLSGQDETARHGLRRVELAGQASLGDVLQTTVTGQILLALALLPDWSGEAQLDLLPETGARLENGEPAWQANLKATCPQLTGPSLEASGLQAEIAAAGTSQTVDRLAVKAGFAAATLAELQAKAQTGEANIEGSHLTLADLEALRQNPLGPFPSGSQAGLKVSAACASLAADLAQVAAFLEQPELASGQMTVQLVAASAEWTGDGPQFTVEIAGSCPDLSVALPDGPRLRAPFDFQAEASGAARRLAATARIQGGEGTVALADASARFAGWQATLAARDIAPETLGQAVERQRLPDGGEVSGTLVLEPITGSLPAPLSGEAEATKTEIGFRFDGKGISAQVASQGTARNLAATWENTPQQAAATEFTLLLQATPQHVDGNVELTLAGLSGGLPDTRLAAESLRVNARCEQLDIRTIAALAADPLGFRANRDAGTIALSLELPNAKADLKDGNRLAGIALATDEIRWTARDGWRTGSEGARLLVAEAMLGGLRLERIVVQASLAGTETRFTVDAPLVGPGVTARLAGQGQLTAEPSFRATVTVPEFTLSTSQGWVLGLADFSGTEFAATLSAQASLRWSARRTSLSLTTKLRDGEATLPNQAGQIKGIETELALSMLPTFRSRPRQRLHFAAARFGQIDFGQGDILFSLDSPQQLFVEKALVDWCGGQLEAYALRFDAEQTDIEATVYARELDAARFVSFFPDTKASGKGRLYGRIPASFKQGKVGYGDGFLYSIPGENGRLQFQQLGVLAPAIRAMGPAGSIVADALTDFDYSLFRVDIRPGGHPQAGIRARLIGAKAEQADAHPIHLNVNIGGTIEEALNLGLKVGGLGDMFQKVGNLQRLLDRLIE